MRQPRTRRRPVCADFVESLELRLLFARIEGVDVSQFQGTMNFTTTYNAGKRFAFIRASRSDTVPDIDLSFNVPAAKSAGLIVGVYHRALPFSFTPDSNDPADFRDPIVDANSFLSVATPYIGAGYMRPVLDIENGASLNTTQVNNYSLNEWVVAWINRVKQVTGVQPIVYCNTNYANIMNRPVSAEYPHIPTNAPDIWIANWEEVNYGNPITGTGNPPQGVWGTGSGWDFWQYSSTGNGATYGATSTYIDLDVFNGANINDLKRRFVIGAPTALPSGPSPGNGATNVSPINRLLNWADTPGATRYDVYLDNMTTPAATNVTESQWNAGNISGGAHSWKVVAKGASNDDDTFIHGPVWTFTASTLPLPGVPSNPTPHNVFVTTKPVVLDWADTPNATSYDVYLGAATTPSIANLTSSQTGPINPFDGVRQWRVVAKNATGSTEGPQWQYTMDATPPAADYGNQTPTDGAAHLDFTITYQDATSGVDFTSLDSSDVYVTLPDGTHHAATLIGLDANANGPTRIATYRIAAPGGTWDTADNGQYIVNQNAAQVRDVAGGFRAAGAIGNFTVNLVQPFAYKLGSTLHIDFDGTATPIALAHAAGTFAATRSGTTLNFTDITAVEVAGTTSDDHLRIGSALPVPLAFDNQAGGDSITMTAGEYTFNDDLNPTLRNIDLTIDAGASAVFADTLHFDRLTINGTAAMTANGANALVVKELAMSDTARLNLSDNDMLIDYAPGAPSPLGSWNGSAYDGVMGRVAAAYDFGAWDLPGIYTDQQDASATVGVTTLAVSEASAALFLGESDTGTYGNETVDGTTVIVKYTYAGDLDLNGYVDAVDYGTIDNWIQFPGTNGFGNGDCNYDGVIDAVDYGVIDNAIQLQGDPR